MPQPKSRAQREAKFMEVARQMHAELEDWYAQHPDASFGAIDAEARRRRRALMGQVLKILINERDTEYQLQSPACPSCGQPMQFERYRPWRVYGLEGDTELEQAYYVCPSCKRQTLLVTVGAPSPRLFPLSSKANAV